MEAVAQSKGATHRTHSDKGAHALSLELHKRKHNTTKHSEVQRLRLLWLPYAQITMKLTFNR